MTAKKQDLSDFSQYCYYITNGKIIQFPTLYKIDKLKHTRIWTIYVRLITKDSAKYPSEMNWNLLSEDLIEITQNLILGKQELKGVLAETWTRAGIIDGVINTTAPMYFEEKNIGRKNYRNALQTALIFANNAYNLQMKKGAKPRKDEEKEEKKIEINRNTLFYPMLASNYPKKDKIIFPFYMQPKLDGLRCLMHKNEKNIIEMYSRQLNPFMGKVSLMKEVEPIFEKFESENKGENLYLDGELYEHGKSLQEISGLARRDGDAKLKYNIYDIFIVQKPNLTFAERLEIINKYVPSGILVAKVPTTVIENEEQKQKFYVEMLEKNYEGAIIRIGSSVYEFSESSPQRSKNLIKMKPIMSDEFEVIGFSEGSGRDAGAIIWRLKTDKGFEFNSIPKNMDYSERRKLFEEAMNHFQTKFKGRKMTVEHRGLSNNGVPLRAKTIGFRDE